LARKLNSTKDLNETVYFVQPFVPKDLS